MEILQNVIAIVGILSGTIFMGITFLGGYYIKNAKLCKKCSFISGLITMLTVCTYGTIFGWNILFIIAMIFWIPTLINTAIELYKEDKC